MKGAIVVCTLLVLAGLADAQDLGRRAPPQTRPIAVVGATVHPVSGPAIERAVVLFEKGRIVLVGESRVRLPEGTEVVDASGKHVYPGFVATDSRLGLTEIGSVRATRDTDEVGGISPEVRAAVAVNPDSTLIPVARRGGVLTVGVFPGGGALCGRAAVLRLSGWTWEDMALSTDAGLVVNWPASRVVSAWWMDKSEDEQKKEMERGRRLLREAFARARAYHAARASGAELPVDVRWEAMRRAFPRGDVCQQPRSSPVIPPTIVTVIPDATP